eukprot:TRINITY_DN677_c0_g1_i2.p1 TRINITY_DN677_c0_g1~~TRINITY_DN677_c0_g1_i2.p1  ORF type:complete len:369 (+),score=111.30 TRINITY_DN677_c0_g1_i2:431-1537(+)
MKGKQAAKPVVGDKGKEKQTPTKAAVVEKANGKANTQPKKVEAKPTPKKAVEKSESESGDESESEEEKVQTKLAVETNKKRDRSIASSVSDEKDSKKLKKTTQKEEDEHKEELKEEEEGEDEEMEEKQEDSEYVGHEKSPNDDLFKLPKTSYQVPIEREGQEGHPLRLHVSNLKFSVRQDQIERFFKDCGKVQVQWIKDKTNHQFYGTIFVTFENDDAAKKALALNEKKLCNRPISIQVPRNQPKQHVAIPKPTPNEDCTTLFIGHVSNEVTDDDIYELFSAIKDDIIQIRWVKDKETGNFKGCGFIKFGSHENLVKALEYDQKELKGKKIKCDFQNEQRTERPRKIFRTERPSKRFNRKDNKGAKKE